MTSIKLCTLLLLSLALSLTVPLTAHAAESYGNCTGFITSVPVVISTPGTWCFNQNLSTSITSGYAISIESDDVTIDCNDYTLDGSAAGQGTDMFGIGMVFDYINVTVRHCSIRGFFVGVQLAGGHHLAQDNLFYGNTALAVGVGGDGGMIRGNLAVSTGRSTYFGANQIVGISADGNVDVLDNTVSGVVATSGTNKNAVGIYVTNDTNGSIRGNRVRGLVKKGSAQAFGIRSDYLTDRIVVRNNELVGDSNANSVGVICINANGQAKDNVIKGFGTGISVCTNDGNNIAP